MKEVSYRIRDAYTTLLNPLTVASITIPIFDERVNPKSTIPTLKGGKSYVLITDQNEVETTNNQCSFRKTVTITLDIITKFPLNIGGKIASELIADKIQRIVLSGVGIQAIYIPEFQVLSSRLEMSRAMIENGDTETAYRKLLVFSHTIYEL